MGSIHSATGVRRRRVRGDSHATCHHSTTACTELNLCALRSTDYIQVSLVGDILSFDFVSAPGLHPRMRIGPREGEARSHRRAVRYSTRRGGGLPSHKIKP